MNKKFNTSDTVEGTSEDVNSSVVNSDHFDDHAPVLATLVHDTPMGASIAADGSVAEKIAYKPSMNEETLYKASEHETISHESTLDTNDSALALLGSDESQQLRTRWSEIQAGFVDEPRTSVQQADALVSEVIEKLTQMFANEHSTLEGQWKEGKDVSTEDLRQALQHYRSFFNRLVV
jgi:hypothetical protein